MILTALFQLAVRILVWLGMLGAGLTIEGIRESRERRER